MKSERRQPPAPNRCQLKSKEWSGAALPRPSLSETSASLTPSGAAIGLFFLCPRDAVSKACSFKLKMNYSDGYPINISLLKGGDTHQRVLRAPHGPKRPTVSCWRKEITVFNLLQELMFF